MQQSQTNLQTDLPTLIPTIHNSTVFEQKCNTLLQWSLRTLEFALWLLIICWDSAVTKRLLYGHTCTIKTRERDAVVTGTKCHMQWRNMTDSEKQQMKIYSFLIHYSLSYASTQFHKPGKEEMRKTIICTGISHTHERNNQLPYGQMVSGLYFNMTRSTGSLLCLTTTVTHFWLLLCHAHRQLAEWATLIVT